jgi:hypothetical protein
MPNTWTESLLAYRYPVDLRKFEDAKMYPEWFNYHSSIGDRESTMQFEAHFRKHASEALEPWLEVVYWKMYSQPGTRRNKETRRRAAHFIDTGVAPQMLLDACNHYIESPTRQYFDSIRTLLGLDSKSIAVAATFPVFLRPDLYPMIDTRVAKWVGHCFGSHNAADTLGPQLIRPHFVDSKQTVLLMNDFPFVEKWVSWCSHTAGKLSARTSIEWRARDVEMAVFNAWGGGHERHPKTDLKPLVA